MAGKGVSPRDDEEWDKPEYRLGLGLKLESELNLNHPFLPLSAMDKRLEVDRRLTGNTHVLCVRSTTAYVIPAKVKLIPSQLISYEEDA